MRYVFKVIKINTYPNFSAPIKSNQIKEDFFLNIHSFMFVQFFICMVHCSSFGSKPKVSHYINGELARALLLPLCFSIGG